LRKEGYRPNEIAVLHRKKHGPANYRSHLSSAKAPGVKLPLRDDTDVSDAVQFTTIHACKGLEYRAVFIVQAQELFQIPSGTPREAQSKFMADELRLLYVAMTRARERLYITYQSKLPPPIEALQEHLRIAREKQE
jgi:superfamily I DNA/RNA helicase